MNSKFTQKIQLSVIIPCFNGADAIALQLEALALQQWSEPWEVIVVNNATENIVAVVEQYRNRLQNLRIVDAAASVGASYARNVGIAAARSDAFVFCDADHKIFSGWLASVGESLGKYDFVSGPLESQLNGTGRSRQEDKQIEARGWNQLPPSFIPWGNSCNFGVTRRVVDTIGRFDESMFFAEDIEFGWRAQRAGFKIHFIRNATGRSRLSHELLTNYRQARNWAKSGLDVRNGYGLVKGEYIKLSLFLGSCKSLLVLLLKIPTKNEQ